MSQKIKVLILIMDFVKKIANEKSELLDIIQQFYSH